MKIKLLFVFVMLLVNYVSAFGVTAFYYQEKPLIVNPGDVKDVQLILQNEKTSQPVTVKAEYIGDSGIAQITGDTMYTLDAGEDNIIVNLRVTIPETAKIGDQYTAGASFKTVAKPGKQMLELGTQISKSFPIVVGRVVEPEEVPKGKVSSKALKWNIILIILILVALVLFIIYRRKKR